jgi:hypothetical protein
MLCFFCAPQTLFLDLVVRNKCTRIFFFLIYVGCPGQLTRTTTIPHGPLDTLQAQEQVRHRGGDRRAHRESNPRRGRNKSHNWPQQLDPQVQCTRILIVKEGCVLADQMIQLSLQKIGRFFLVISSVFFFLVCLSRRVFRKKPN